MKKSLLCIAFVAIACLCKAQEYKFDHGPYLQEVGEDKTTVVFTTNKNGFSWIEIKGDDGAVKTIYDMQDGLRNANNKFNAVRIDGLAAASRYSYRLCSKEISGFEPYKVTFGDSITSKWYDFHTLDPKLNKYSFVAISDIHQDSAKLRTLLGLADVGSAEIVFYVGDMMNYYDNEAAPYMGFIDTSVDMFASEKPFVLVRGNHETRGALAREYHRFAPNRNGKFYGMYKVGDVAFVILDGGEDKKDSHPVYAGLTDFDDYRTAQGEWLKEVVKSDCFRQAKYRVVMSHFPPFSSKETIDHGMREINDKIMPVLNSANVDVMFAGHTHIFEKIDPLEGKNSFPIIIGSNKSVSRIDVDDKTMKIKVVDVKGNILTEYIITKKR